MTEVAQHIGRCRRLKSASALVLSMSVGTIGVGVFANSAAYATAVDVFDSSNLATPFGVI